MEDVVLVEALESGVAVITFNRPEKRNAMNKAMQEALVSEITKLKGKSKVIILTANGPAFCAGVDLKEKQQELAGAERAYATGGDSWREVQEAIRRHPAVFIAAVNGYALGGGATLINTCDLAIAADTAEIGMPEVTLGIYPGLAGPSTQMRILRKRASWLVLTGARIDGKKAADWGLVNESVPSDQLMQASMGLAERIAAFDAVTLDWCKKALWEVPMHISDWTAALEYGDHVDQQIRAGGSSFQQGLAAFNKASDSTGPQSSSV